MSIYNCVGANKVSKQLDMHGDVFEITSIFDRATFYFLQQ